ncbi:haloacid dehalogenase superfamily, subfamily IA, variant 3 with third motif having DD or ED [Burkholderia sp. D7]|nr:haloacid dehalogenase superfamily, subfamily IA, variant 3 with third motif having DD or ED [Burkholderia sp. D7]
MSEPAFSPLTPANGAVSFDAVLFDCDGTLVESEPITFRVLSDMLHTAGWKISVHEFSELFLGQSVKSRFDLIRSRTAVVDIEAWYLDYRDRRDQALSREVAATPFAGEIVKHLARHKVRLAVVSASSRSKIALQLDKVGLTGWFGCHIYSGQHSRRNKPWPDVYLEAASSLGVDIRRCAIVEDSPSGVLAGVSAGATVYGYSPSHREPGQCGRLLAAGAKDVFGDMRMLQRMLTGTRMV